MTMWIEISCTSCGRFLDGVVYSSGMSTKLKNKAIKSGWKHIEKYNRFFCPNCKARVGEEDA